MNSLVPIMSRPLPVGQILDRAIRLFQSNAKSCVAIAAVVELPIALGWVGNDLLIRSQLMTPDVRAYTVIFWMGFILLLRLVSYMALAWGVVQVYMVGRMNFAAAYRQLVSRMGSLLITLLVIILGSVVVIAWYFIPCIGPLSGLSIALFYFIVLVPLTIPAMMLEYEQGTAALRRAWELTRWKFWSAFGFACLVLLLGGAMTGPRLLLRYGIQLFASDFDMSAPFLGTSLQFFSPSLTISMAIHLVDLIMNLLTWPILMIAMTLFYLDLRMRQEGLDLQIAAAALLADERPAEIILTKAPAFKGGPLIRSDELTRFVGLNIIIIIAPLLLLLGIFVFWVSR